MSSKKPTSSTSSGTQTKKAARAKIVKAPVAVSVSTRRRRVPQFRHESDSIVVSHEEYVLDVSGSVAFSVESFNIQPGLNTTFPWLSRVAQMYERYELLELTLLYEPFCSTATAGVVYLAVDPDPNDSGPSDKGQMCNYEHMARSSAWAPSRLGVKGSVFSTLSRWHFIRGANAQPSTIATSDVGNMLLATFGMSGTASVGELYVSYRVRLSTPSLERQIIQSQDATIVVCNPLATSQTYLLFGSSPSITGALLQQIVLTSGSVTQINILVPGTFYMSYQIIGTSITSSAVAIAVAGCATTSIMSVVNGLGTIGIFQFLVQVTADTATFSLGNFGSSTLSSVILRAYASPF